MGKTIKGKKNKQKTSYNLQFDYISFLITFHLKVIFILGNYFHHGDFKQFNFKTIRIQLS